MKYQLDRFNIKLRVQYIQYYKVVKIGYILFLTPKAEVQEQTEFLKEKLKTILGYNVHFALSISKISNSTFKDKSHKQKRTIVKREKKENIGVHAEIVKSSRYYLKEYQRRYQHQKSQRIDTGLN